MSSYNSKCKLIIYSKDEIHNKEAEKPYNNLLRLTTEAMSAYIGGADIIELSYYDSKVSDPNDRSRRLSRNIQHLLRFESGLDFVNDPAFGSYYIEHLTNFFLSKCETKEKTILQPIMRLKQD